MFLVASSGSPQSGPGQRADLPSAALANGRLSRKLPQVAVCSPLGSHSNGNACRRNITALFFWTEMLAMAFQLSSNERKLQTPSTRSLRLLENRDRRALVSYSASGALK